MSDPTLSVPEPEPTAPRRKVGRRWIVLIAVVIVLALGLGSAAYGVRAEGDERAKQHAEALDAWNDQRNELLGAPSEANRTLWDFNDASTKESLTKQKAACQQVLTLRTSVTENAAALPKEPDNFFKVLSSDERDAISESVVREKALKAYAEAADKVLVQLRRDCVWNIRLNSAKEGDSGAKKILGEAKDLLLEPGRTAGNYYCPSSAKAPCLPASQADRTIYAELILKALKVDKAYVMKRYFAAGSCDSTSYAELCATMKTSLASYYGNVSDYSAVYASIDPSNDKLKQEFEQMKSGNKLADKAFSKALFKARPGFKSDPRLSQNPFWQEAYFSASGDKAIANLTKLARAVQDGSPNADSTEVLGELSHVRLR